MKKFINSVDTVLTETLDGFAAAHSAYPRAWRGPQIHLVARN
ncbi:hypothetical protein ACVOMV_09830 [Mesorhizobium atlanticum]